MAFTEDFSLFFDTDEFAVEAVITPAGGSAFSVDGIFNDGYQERSREFVDIASRDTMLTCPAFAQVLALKKGDAAVIGGQNYKILQAKPSGDGLAIITLEKVAV